MSLPCLCILLVFACLFLCVFAVFAAIKNTYIHVFLYFYNSTLLVFYLGSAGEESLSTGTVFLLGNPSGSSRLFLFNVF